MRTEQKSRCRSMAAIAGVAIALAVFGPAAAAPAGAAVGASQTIRPLNAPYCDVQVLATQRSSAKPPKVKTNTSTSPGFHLGKRDDFEILVLALLPFVVMALFLFSSGYFREKHEPVSYTHLTLPTILRV